MNAASVAELLALALLWGASFLCVRLGAAEFGAVALAGSRVVGAAVLLLPLLALSGRLSALQTHWRPLLWVGITNSAIPFLCYCYAALSISAGLSAIFNAATPLFAAVIAWAWLGERPTRLRTLGLFIGFAGVAGLVWHQATFKPGGSGSAIAACLAAALCYGYSASYTRRHLSAVPPLAVAAGSLLGAALCLALPMGLYWPTQPVSTRAWAAAALLAFGCTGLAYVMYFRLIGRIGPARAVTVTFLVPLFAVLWGHWLLDERLTLAMAIGCLVILLGTALATGLVRLRPSTVPAK